MSAPVIPNCLTIAGSDSGGGAGIQADIKSFSAQGVYSASVLTALTAQNTQGVSAIHDIPPHFIAEQIDAVFTDLEISAVKIGMLSQSSVIETVAERLKHHHAKQIVLDPVMVAASGDPLLAKQAERDIVAQLFPISLIITPNLHEAAQILNVSPAQSRDEMTVQAKQLRDLGASAVLLKGGHAVEANECPDLLVDAAGTQHWFTGPRYDTQNTHGTGCSLSSAIAANLAKGCSLEDAVGIAKTFISDAIRSADNLNVGRGHGPVHHFHALWATS